MTNRRRIVAGVVLLLVVNTLVNLYRIVPERLFLAALLPSVEIALIVVALALLPVRRARGFAWVASPSVVLLALYGLAETFYRFIYRESVDPFRDLSFLGPFFAMVTGIERLSTAAVVAVSVVLAGAISVALALAIRTLLPDRSRRAVRVGLAAAVALLWTLRAVVLPVASPISVVMVRGLAGAAVVSGEAPANGDAAGDGVADAGTADGAAASGADPGGSMPEPVRDPFLGRSDVTILVIESYGHTLFSRPDHNERIVPVYDELAGVLAAEEITVYSAFVRSPAFGGRSWLADGTILSGQWLGNQEIHDSVFSSPDPNLPRDLEEAGYWNAVFAPAMSYFEDEYFTFYPFQATYQLEDLDYRGPVFEFGRLTDQFLLWRVQEHAKGARRENPDRPVFSFVMMISSHVPFRLVPPFLDNWDELGNGEVYDDLERTWFDNNWLTGGEYPEGYTTSIAYSLRAAVEYVTNFATPDELVVIVGDHQPRIPISEPESTYSVPMHVLSRNGEVVDALGERGFSVGLVPGTDPEFMWMNEIYPLVMDLLTTPSGE